MKLWLLRPHDRNHPRFDDWDTYQGFVISAETPEQARRIAQESGGAETHANNYTDRFPAWIDPAYSSCVELEPTAEPGIIISDFNAG